MEMLKAILDEYQEHPDLCRKRAFMLQLLLVRQEEMEQQAGTKGNVMLIGLILMRMMVIASEEWKGGEIDECIVCYHEIQLHRCVCGEQLEHV